MSIFDFLKSLLKVVMIPLANNQNVICFRDTEGYEYYAFFSYQSLIAISCPASTFPLVVNMDKWDYSKTTLKWFNYFLNTFTDTHYESVGFKHRFTQLLANPKTYNIFPFYEDK